MREEVIISAVRTPTGKFLGSLKDFTAPQLGAIAVREAVRRAGIDPAVVVLLVGERPGLATAESLSAYLAYRPRSGHTDAHRNLISNIHARGIGPDAAAGRILRLAEKMLRLQTSGVVVKEEIPAELVPNALPEPPPEP